MRSEVQWFDRGLEQVNFNKIRKHDNTSNGLGAISHVPILSDGLLRAEAVPPPSALLSHSLPCG